MVNNIELNILGQTIKPTSRVKLLGVFIDDLMFFDKYVFELCIIRTARQTNALRRIVKCCVLNRQIYGFYCF